MRETDPRLQTPSGLDVIGSFQWGSHFTQLYKEENDLRDVLVPYFKTGLENNESCLWVTAAPFGANQARSALRAAVADFDVRERRKQIEIRDAHEWYSAGDKLSPREIVLGLMQREQDAIKLGYQGLRTNGNCAWVDRGQWNDFQDYESLVQEAVRGRRMICMCSYCLDQTQSSEIIDVMDRHDFLLPQQNRNKRMGPVLRRPVLDEHSSKILEAIPAAIYTTDAAGYLTYYNEAAARLWGCRPEIGKQRWCGTWKIFLFDGTHVPHDQCPMAVAVQTGQPVHGIEADAERPDGTRVPCAVFPTPLFDENGKVVGGINMLVDITDRKTAEERHATLAREMHHRVNNTLATVQAIMSSTGRHATTMDEFQQSFSSRISSLSRTHTLLIKRTHSSVSLRHLLDNELAMFTDGDGSRVTLDGPDLVVTDKLAVPLGMAFHELTTNAAKYGALSVLGGTLSVKWHQSEGSLELDWQERNVAIEREAKRVGFGTKLLKEIIPQQTGGHIKIEYQPTGLNARMRIPLTSS
jgi:PAS domain S-box-containing protein